CINNAVIFPDTQEVWRGTAALQLKYRQIIGPPPMSLTVCKGPEPMSTEQQTTFYEPRLSSTEIRILGSLIEKQATSPETYPLTLNALVIACNQNTSREPVTNLTQGQVGQSLRALEGRGFTKLVMGSRADRWEHKVDKALELVPAQVILAGLL